MTTIASQKPRMLVFAGPNGSGKSTMTSKLMRHRSFPTTYINADDIARTELAHIPDELQRNMEAAKLAQQRRQAALAGGQSFAFETVMSTPGKLAILQEAKARGFQLELVFVTTFDAAINVHRVANRAALGGHNVEPVKVRERYERGMSLLPSALFLADGADIFDNSSSKTLCVAKKRGQKLTLLNIDKAPAWVFERLAKPCRERAASRGHMHAACQQHAADAGVATAVVHEACISCGQQHQGVVIEADTYHIAQQVEAGVYLIHERALCPHTDAEKGENALFAYRYEKGGKHSAAV